MTRQIKQNVHRKQKQAEKFYGGFHGNLRNSSLPLYLKMLVLVSTIMVPKFMLVSKSAQFARNFELCRRTTNNIVLCERCDNQHVTSVGKRKQSEFEPMTSQTPGGRSIH